MAVTDVVPDRATWPIRALPPPPSVGHRALAAFAAVLLGSLIAVMAVMAPSARADALCLNKAGKFVACKTTKATGHTLTPVTQPATKTPATKTPATKTPSTTPAPVPAPASGAPAPVQGVRHVTLSGISKVPAAATLAVVLLAAEVVFLVGVSTNRRRRTPSTGV